MSSGAESAVLPALNVLAGERPPPSIPGDIAALLALPEAARAAFREVLLPCLAPVLGPETDAAIDAFCSQQGVAGNQVAAAVRGARFLLWEAAKGAAPEAALAGDLLALAGERSGELLDILLPVYEAAKDSIRADVIRRTIVDHGAVLTSVDWRLDRVLASQHGRVVDVELALLTFAYRDGGQERRLTLQCDPGTLARLRAVCDRLLK